MQSDSAEFGSALRWWRTTRRFSQFQLAAEAEVSTRHISFLETGRAKPSREMVVHFGIVLDLPLRDRNRLLHTAGFAPLYPQAEYDAPELNEVRGVLRSILEAHVPNPAIVVDRRGDIIDANVAGFSMIGACIAADSPALIPVPNINRLTFHPAGIRDRSSNWPELAGSVLQRLERECAFRPADRLLAGLLDEMLGYPDVADLHHSSTLPSGADLLVTLDLTTFAAEQLSLMSTIATIGAPYDVTLDELRLETFFPADSATQSVLSVWANQ